jgi:hypothetical protein
VVREARAHGERLEDPSPHVIVVAHPRHRLDHLAEDDVVQARVLEAHPGRARRGDVVEAGLVLGAAIVTVPLPQSARVGEQVTQGDRLGEAGPLQREARQVALDRVVEAQPPVVDELRDGQGGEGLAHRTDEERRVRRERTTPVAEARDVGFPLGADDDHHGTRDPRPSYLALDQSRDGRRVGRGGGGRRNVQERGQKSQDQGHDHGFGLPGAPSDHAAKTGARGPTIQAPGR